EARENAGIAHFPPLLAALPFFGVFRVLRGYRPHPGVSGAACCHTFGNKCESIKLYGRPIDVPRLTAWYGEAGTGYTYSGIVNEPQPWTPALLEVKRAVEVPAGVTFNSVLLNRYRTGRDSVAWHSDDEKEFGENPVIASVSFGGTRTFQFKHKKRKDL